MDITQLDENKKEQLRNAIRYFSGEHNNIMLQIINKQEKMNAGGIFFTEEILHEFQDLIGIENAYLEEITM